MSDLAMGTRQPRTEPGRPQGYRPPEPTKPPPLFVWPFSPMALLTWVFGNPGYLWPFNTAYLGIALITWTWLSPSADTTRTLAAGWIALVALRNAALVLLVVGAWHWRLYVQRAQDVHYKYNSRWLAQDSGSFLFRSQLIDNMFWTFVSGVPVWTAFEVVTLWGQSNGYLPTMTWSAHPIACAALLVLIPVWREAHFYTVHRLIHWPPLYRAVHKLHHANVNPGPWSGLAMHPVEHLLYFSGVLLHWIVPSSPLHVIFHLQHLALTPAQGHSGFDKVVLPDGRLLDADHYTHYLHHKYFEVNYGDGLVPLDRLFGTFHDGSDAGQDAMNKRRAKRLDKRSSGRSGSA